jgi:hypothetical protein
MAASGEPTRAQSGRLEKLRDAVREAKQALQEQTAELDAARSKLGQYGIPLDGVATERRIYWRRGPRAEDQGPARCAPLRVAAGDRS